MKVADYVKHLLALPQDVEVVCYDQDNGVYLDVTVPAVSAVAVEADGRRTVLAIAEAMLADDPSMDPHLTQNVVVLCTYGDKP